MTKEEIREAYTMKDILFRYGLQASRAGFICCPFHQGDRNASLKIYEKDWHCFGCGAHGDIFDFVMRIEEMSFTEAFRMLGGTYQKPHFQSELAIYRANRKREMVRKQQEKQREEKQLNQELISVYRKYVDNEEPLSDAWVDCYNALRYQLYIHDILNKRR